MEFTSEKGTYIICLNENKEEKSQSIIISDFRYYDGDISCNNLNEIIELRNALNRTIEYYTKN